MPRTWAQSLADLLKTKQRLEQESKTMTQTLMQRSRDLPRRFQEPFGPDQVDSDSDSDNDRDSGSDESVSESGN